MQFPFTFASTFAAGYELITNRVYNANQGPVSIFSGRLHGEFLLWVKNGSRRRPEPLLLYPPESGHCIGFGAFVSPAGAFIVYDPMSRIR